MKVRVMKSLILALAILLSGPAVFSSETRPNPGEKDVIVDSVRYDTRAGYPLHLYVIRPADADSLLPCILYVPGSAWKKQGMQRAVRLMKQLARKGFAVACVEYRPCSVSLFPAQVEDVKTATRYLRLHASAYGLDTDNFFAWGSSSGAHVLLLQALTQDSALLDNGSMSDVSCRVNAVVDYYGPTELVREFRIKDGYQENPDANGGLLLGDPVWEKRDVALKASPLYYVHPYAVPVFVVHGDQDKVVPLEQATLFIARMEECGAPFEYLLLEGEAHGSAGFWTGEMFDKVAAFFRKNMIKATR